MAEKTYYWLKMPKGFLDKHYMKMIRRKDNGIELCLFYIWMLTESVDHGATLRYSDKLPYDSETLSDASGFSEEIVNEGLRVFQKYELIEILDNKTIFMVKGNEMIGSETSAAARMRKYRECNNVPESDSDVTPKSQSSDEHIEKDIDIDKEKDKKTMCKAKANALFEELWKLYPSKKGKGQISDANKKRLLDIGFDELERAINRYKADLEKDEWRKPQNGSTFFNSGYVDYLDLNYESKEDLTPEKAPTEEEPIGEEISDEEFERMVREGEL